MPPAPSRRSTRYRPASNSPTRSPAKLGTTSSTAPSRFKPTVPSCFDQCKFLLHHVPADPHDLGTAHDGVHGVWRAHERLFVGSRDLGAREVIPAALSRRMIVDHADRPRPPGVLARRFRHDLRRRRPQRATATEVVPET